MAYQGYLVKINGTVFPKKYMKINTYKINPNQEQDEDSYEDGDGKLHRNVLPHKRTKCEFYTIPIWEADNRIIQNLFPDADTITVQLWNPRKGIYETATCYTPNIEFPIIEDTNTDVHYDSLRIAFIEY